MSSQFDPQPCIHNFGTSSKLVPSLYTEAKQEFASHSTQRSANHCGILEQWMAVNDPVNRWRFGFVYADLQDDELPRCAFVERAEDK